MAPMLLHALMCFRHTKMVWQMVMNLMDLEWWWSTHDDHGRVQRATHAITRLPFCQPVQSCQRQPAQLACVCRQASAQATEGWHSSLARHGVSGDTPTWQGCPSGPASSWDQQSCFGLEPLHGVKTPLAMTRKPCRDYRQRTPCTCTVLEFCCCDGCRSQCGVTA